MKTITSSVCPPSIMRRQNTALQYCTRVTAPKAPTAPVTMSADSQQASKINPASSSSPPNSPGIERLEVAFPPDDEGVSALIGYCNKGMLPVKFGRDVSLESYNKWLLNSETGLRVSYDIGDRCVLLREGCYPSHSSTRAA